MKDTISIRENKLYYYVYDRYSNFMCRITKKTSSNFQRLLADCIIGKITPSRYDDTYYNIFEWFRVYECKGITYSISKYRIADVLLSLSLHKHEIKDKKDLAKLLGFKTYCKSVDKILKSLPLSSIAMLYIKLRKEITYGKTSSRD